MKQTSLRGKQDDEEKFRDVAIEGWELGKADFIIGRDPFFLTPQTYFEKAYCLGYMEMKHADNCKRFREIANSGFELGAADCHQGKDLFFKDPQTYYEKGYFLGYTLTKTTIAESDRENLAV